jgi:hypothetical protein
MASYTVTLRADPTLYPVSPDRRSEQRSRSARLGMPASSDDLPSAQNDSLRPSQYTNEPATRVVRIYDASEGTALDPLKNKTWDLNSAKTVPDLRPEDSAERASTGSKKPRQQSAQANAKPVEQAEQKAANKPAPAPKPKPTPARKPAPEADDENATN